MNIHFKITNITCDACIKLSSAALRSLPGVTTVTIEKDGTATVKSDGELSWEDIKTALAEVDKIAEK